MTGYSGVEKSLGWMQLGNHWLQLRKSRKHQETWDYELNFLRRGPLNCRDDNFEEEGKCYVRARVCERELYSEKSIYRFPSSADGCHFVLKLFVCFVLVLGFELSSRELPLSCAFNKPLS